jgi:hypothetical protein
MRLPGIAEGSQMHRRLRERRRVREDMLLDLGALVYELHRQGRRAPELLQEKAAQLSLVDDEVRALEQALGGVGPEADQIERPTAEVDAAELPGPDEPELDDDYDYEDELADAEPQPALANAREPRL